MQKTFSLKAKNVVAYIAFAMMALVSTSAKADEEVDFRSIATEIKKSCTINVSYSSSASNYSNGYCWYKFTAPSSGTFTVYSSGNEDTFAELHDENGGFLDEDDDNGSDYNFKIEHEDTENATYYLGVKKYSNEAGNFSVTFRFPCPHANIQFVAEKTASCTETGNIAYYECQDCGKCFSDQNASNLIDIVETAKAHTFNSDGICSSCGTIYNPNDYLAFTAVGGDVSLILRTLRSYDNIYQNAEGNWEGTVGYGINPVDFYIQTSFDAKTWGVQQLMHYELRMKFDFNQISGFWLDQHGVPHFNFVSGYPSPFWTEETFPKYTIANIPEGKTLYVRNTSSMDWISFEYGYWYFETSGNGKCKVTGNIMSMLSNDPANNNSVSTNGLRNLFNSENFAMAEGSRIMFPATEATYQSYSNMFAESHASNITVYMPNSVIEENNFGYGIVPVTLNGLNLNDNMSNDIISSVVASTETYGPVTYHRAIKANWNTVCLPFAVKSTEYNKFYTIASLENGVITLKAEDELAQGVPALLYTTMKDELIIDGDGTLVSSPANTTDDNRLVGTFAGTTVPGSDASKYYFGLSANTGKYVKVSSDVALKPFRAYIECEKASGNAAGLRHRIEGEDLNETAIAEVVETLNDSEAQYFDMNGRKMNGLQKGLNIIKINGTTKKVIIK